MNKSSILILFVGFLVVSACAPERNTVFSNSYHSVTAHYNAYYIAREDIRQIEAIIEDRFEWNYNLILPIFPQFDTVLAQSYNEQIEHCITKASLAIQFHKGSDWEDDSYNLVGLARFYDVDYVNAIETFKYVNTRGKDDNAKHEALVYLMRTFIEYGELNNGIAVSDHLKNEKLNRKNLKNLYLTRAYLYQKRGDLNNMVQNLAQAEPLITKMKERARINFIVGQVYQSLGFDGEAYAYYKATLKSNPAYELSFYTKLNMAQVTQLAKTNDIKKIRKYFKKLLKDRKNEEFKDKIYYEMAQFEVRNGNLDLGIQYYNSSVRSSVNNKRQLAYSYWSLGKIYYDSLANYKMAKLYYDSTMSALPKDEIEYEAIAARQVILENFVKQLTVIQENDSLLHLTSLSSDSLNAFLDQYIAKEEEAENARREEAKKKERQQAASFGGFLEEEGPISFGANNYEGSIWYFYNPSSISRGKSAFQSRWGNRTLEDNWRLASKAPPTVAENDTDTQERSAQGSSEDNTKEDAVFKIDKSELISALPNTDEQKQVLLDEIEEATYLLGNIYNFDLKEKENAIETFKTLLSRFGESEYKYEVMYQLYLILAEIGLVSESEHYKQLILNEAPESIYGKLIINPNYREDSQLESERLKKIYAQAYSLYKSGNYKNALALADKGLVENTDNDFIDNMQLLKILIKGKTESIYLYEAELNNFIKSYSESELIPYAETLVTASEQYQINVTNSSKAKFVNDFNQSHFFVFIYQTDEELSTLLPEYFQTLLTNEENLSVGNLLLDEEHSMILIKQFQDKSAASQFNSKINKENPAEKINKTGKFYNFVITKENFDIFYQTKELDTYLTFYRKNYPNQ